jgi:hypothetical protein
MVGEFPPFVFLGFFVRYQAKTGNLQLIAERRPLFDISQPQSQKLDIDTDI